MSATGDEVTPEDELSDLLETLVEAFDLDATVTTKRDGEIVSGSVDGPDARVLVGEGGAILDAVAHLATRIVLRGERGTRVTVDVDGYRAGRAVELQAEADRVADLVVADGVPVALDPMGAAERRVVHEHLRERGDVDTHSEGDEPRRRLVVSPRPA